MICLVRSQNRGRADHSCSPLACFTATFAALCPALVLAQCGEGFIEFSASNDVEFLDAQIIDENTLLPMPTTFTGDAGCNYQLDGLLYIEGSEIGSFEITGNTRGEFLTTLAVDGGPDNGLALFAGWIVGIQIEDADNAAAREFIQNLLSASTTGTAGNPPAEVSVFQNAFLEDTSDVESRAADGIGGSILVPGETSFHNPGTAIEVPDLKTLIVQTDLTAFNLAPDTRFVPTIQSGALIYKEVPICPTDFNGDGKVDKLDLSVWQKNYGVQLAASRRDGDADGDGDVDSEDFLAWQRDNAKTAPPNHALTAPEPSTLVLMLLAAAALCNPPQPKA